MAEREKPQDRTDERSKRKKFQKRRAVDKDARGRLYLINPFPPRMKRTIHTTLPPRAYRLSHHELISHRQETQAGVQGPTRERGCQIIVEGQVDGATAARG